MHKRIYSPSYIPTPAIVSISTFSSNHGQNELLENNLGVFMSFPKQNILTSEVIRWLFLRLLLLFFEEHFLFFEGTVQKGTQSYRFFFEEYIQIS